MMKKIIIGLWVLLVIGLVAMLLVFTGIAKGWQRRGLSQPHGEHRAAAT